jgi:hypothetical protein
VAASAWVRSREAVEPLAKYLEKRGWTREPNTTWAPLQRDGQNSTLDGPAGEAEETGCVIINLTESGEEPSRERRAA